MTKMVTDETIIEAKKLLKDHIVPLPKEGWVVIVPGEGSGTLCALSGSFAFYSARKSLIFS